MQNLTPNEIKNLALEYSSRYQTIRSSKHAKLQFKTFYTSGIVEYARSANCRDLEYNNVAVKLIGRTLTSFTQFAGKIQIKSNKVWFNRHTKIVAAANLSDTVAVYRNEQLCIMRKLATGEKAGYAVKNIDGTWSHGKTIREAIDEKIRQEKIQREKSIATRKHHLVKLLCKNWTVTREDSYFAGNCQIGTENFLREQNLSSRKFLNSRELKSIAQNNERAKRVYDYAIDLIAR